MEIKVLCGCGQKFKFDVEPVGGRMPFTVNCPVCGTDGTPAANTILSQNVPVLPPPPPPVAAAAGRLQINRPVQAAEPAAEATPPAITPRPPAMPGVLPKLQKMKGQFSMGLGIAGALIGAAVGVGLMYAFYQWANFRFPLMGVGIGVLTGLGAKLLSRGTDMTLGVICGAIAAVSVIGALYLMYGTFPILSIISVVVSISVAYRIASG
jgi:hypothetical protein